MLIPLKKRRKFFQRNQVKKIEFEKPNTQGRRKVLVLEIALILLVLGGTAFGLIRVLEFSPEKFLQDTLDNFAPRPQVVVERKAEEDKAFLIIDSLPKELFTLDKETARSSEHLVLVSKQGTTAVFSLTKNIESQLNTLQNLLTAAKINKRKVKKVDFRFEKLVVTYGK